MNVMKISFAFFLAIEAKNFNDQNLGISCTAMAFLSISALASFFVLRRWHDRLKYKEISAKIGTLYQGKNVERGDHYV